MTDECRNEFEKWFSPKTHDEKSLSVLGIRGVLWVAFQTGWQSAGDWAYVSTRPPLDPSMDFIDELDAAIRLYHPELRAKRTNAGEIARQVAHHLRGPLDTEEVIEAARAGIVKHWHDNDICGSDADLPSKEEMRAALQAIGNMRGKNDHKN